VRVTRVAVFAGEYASTVGICSAAVFLPFLREHFPELAANYEQRFRGQAFLPPSYRKRISQLMANLRTKYEIGDEYGRYSKRAHPVRLSLYQEQMSLFQATLKPCPTSDRHL
jgi:hypothetical protein